MPESIQLHILKAISAHIEGVIPANGYDFDLTDAVFRGRLLYGEESPETMISIVENLQGDITTDTAGENQVERTETWILFVQGIAKKDDAANPTDIVYNLKASVEHRLARAIKQNQYGDPEFPLEYFFGLRDLKVITGLTIGPGIVSPPRQGISDKAFFYLPLGVGLATNISEPWVP